MKTKKYNLGVQKVDVSPGSQGNEKFLYGNQYGQMGAGLGGTVGSGIGMAVGGPMGAQVGKLAGTALGYGAGYLIGNQKGKQIATEMDTQRGNELNINKSIDYQNDNFSGKDMYQDKKMFENTGYLDNKQLYAKYGLKNAPKEKIEVEKDEMIFRKDPKNGRTMLVADFKGGQPHSKGGEDFLAQDGDVIYPGKMRDQIKSLVGQDGYVTDEETFEVYRQQLPEDNESQEMAMGTGGYLGLANDIMNTGSQLMNFNKNIKAMDKQMLSGQPQMPQQQNKAMGSILGAGQSLLGMLGNKQGGAIPIPEYPNGVKSKVIKPINAVTNNYDSNRERSYMKLVQETELDKLKRKHRVQKTLDKILKVSSITSMLGLTQLYGDKFKTEAEMQKEKDILKKNKSVPFINSFFQTPEQYWGNSDKVKNVTNTFKKEEYDGFIEEIQSLDSESQKEIIDTLVQSGNKELSDTLKQTLVTPTTNKQNIYSSKPNSLVFNGTNTGKYNINPNNPLGKPVLKPQELQESQNDRFKRLKLIYDSGPMAWFEDIKYNSDKEMYEFYTWMDLENEKNTPEDIPEERFTMKDGKFLDSQYKGKITDTDRLAFKEWLGKQNQDIQRQYYKDNVAKPELPIQSGEDMSRDDIAFQMENEAPFSKAANKPSNAKVPYTEEGSNEVNKDTDERLSKMKAEYFGKKYEDGVSYFNSKYKLNPNNPTSMLGGNALNYNPSLNPSIQYTVEAGKEWPQIDMQYGLMPGTSKGVNNGMPISGTENSYRTNPYQLDRKKERGNDILHPGEQVNVPYNKYKGLPLMFNKYAFNQGDQENTGSSDLQGGSGGLIPPQKTTQTIENIGDGGKGGIMTPKSPYFNGMYPSLGTDSNFNIPNLSGEVSKMEDGIPTTTTSEDLNPIINAASKVANNTNATTTPDSKSSFLNMVPNIIGTGANMLYAHGLTKERPEVRQATRVQLEQMKYQDRSNPQRYQNLLGSKLAMKNATNYAGGSINNLLGASAMSNAAYQQQANQIEQGESGVAMGIDQQNVGIKNQQNILNGQYFDQNKTANEMNDAKTRDIQRQGRLGMATTANQSIQNAQTLQKDNLMQKESDRRYGLQEKLYGNQLSAANEQTEAMERTDYYRTLEHLKAYPDDKTLQGLKKYYEQKYAKKYNLSIE